MVVLDKIEIQSGLAKGLAIPCFHEEATGIAEDFWFQKPCVMNFGWNFFHKVEEPRISQMGTDEKMLLARKAH